MTRLVQCAHMRWCGEVGVGGVRGQVFGGRGWAWCFAGAQRHHRATTIPIPEHRAELEI